MADWIQVDIETTTEGIDPVAAILLDLGLGYVVQDSTDFEQFLEGKHGHWDYIDESLMALRTAPTIVTVYLSNQQQGVDALAQITKELDRLKFLAEGTQWGSLSYQLSGVNEEDWANAWKQYYHPVRIGKKLIVSPRWISTEAKPGEVVISMDPGMAFGTGTHESTKLCLALLEECVMGGESVLDIGTGSGILSIASVLLGAQQATGIDIDAVAVGVAQENVEINGVADSVTILHGNFAENVEATFDIVVANIVADAILTILPNIAKLLNLQGVFICSGIIDTRAEEIQTALYKAGFEKVINKEENGWVAFYAK